MALLPPEHPDTEAENATPQEARLLTRRDRGEERESPSATPSPTAPYPPLQAGFSRPRNSPPSGDPAPPASPRRARPAHSRVRGLRRLGIGLTALLLLLCAALLLTGIWLRHAMHASLPQLDRELHLPGLSAPVSVERDAHGVPTLHAATLDDLLFAQGFVTAQDRLWQMDSLRRHASGELAEILGPSLVEHDRLERTLQLRAAADRAVLTLPPDQLEQLEAYARGVNALIEQTQTGSHQLPVEFHLLHYRPAPWTPRDSLLVSLVMFQDLSTQFPVKLNREALAAHLPPELLPDLYPIGSWRDIPPGQPPPDLTTPKPEIPQIPLDDSQISLRLPPTLAPADPSGVPAIGSGQIAGLPTPSCADCRAGSNNWAVSGLHTASGRPLVSNDMHLSLAAPDIWYEACLHSAASPAQAAMDVTGFTLPGVPFVIVGRNAHVAWGVTNLGADVQDLRIEHLRGSGDNTEFEQPDGSWAPVLHHRELIRVRGGRDLTLNVLATTAHIGPAEIQTPILSGLDPREHRALALLWTAYDPHNVTSPFFAVNTASSGAALVASLASFGGPSLNLVYGDDAGHIGYHALGRIPIRGPADRRPRPLPTDAPPPPPQVPAPPDEDSGQGADPARTASLNPALNPALPPSAAHLELASYQRRRPVLSHPAERPTERPAKHPARRPARQRRTAEPAPKAAAPDLSIPASIPLRDYTVGSAPSPLPFDALDATQQWSSYIPYNELPSVVDPPDGILVTANARIAPDDYPYFLGDNWEASYRTERIHRLLAGGNGLTPADMLAIEFDTISAFDRLLGERLVYAIDHASASALGSSPRQARQAADLLRHWNGNMAAASPAAAIVYATREQLWPTLLGPQIARHDHLPSTSAAALQASGLYQWGESSYALELLLTHQPARWLPSGVANWNDLLTEAMLRGVAQQHAPSDLGHWTYGSIHTVAIDHPVFSMSPLFGPLLGVRTGTGSQPSGGDGTTIRAIGHHFGPSERFTADLSAADQTTANLTTGQSGNPASNSYLDQFHAWLHGSTFAMPLGGNQTTHTLRLLP